MTKGLIFFIYFLFGTVLIPGIYAQSSVKGERGAVIKGVVQDPFDAVLPNVPVIFEKNGKKRQVLTNDYGEYEIKLPEGNYTVKVAQRGFCDSTRPLFEINGNENIVFNFILFPCSILNVAVVDEKTGQTVDKDVAGRPFQEKTWKICEPKQSFLLLMRYGKVAQENGNDVYSGFSTTMNVANRQRVTTTLQKQMPVTIMFNRTTITADNVHFIPAENRLVLRGSVNRSDGGQANRAEELQLTLCSN